MHKNRKVAKLIKYIGRSAPKVGNPTGRNRRLDKLRRCIICGTPHNCRGRKCLRCANKRAVFIKPHLVNGYYRILG